MLEGLQKRSEFRSIGPAFQGDPQSGIQLVDIAVGIDPRIRLRASTLSFDPLSSGLRSGRCGPDGRPHDRIRMFGPAAVRTETSSLDRQVEDRQRAEIRDARSLFEGQFVASRGVLEDRAHFRNRR